MLINNAPPSQPPVLFPPSLSLMRSLLTFLPPLYPHALIPPFSPSPQPQSPLPCLLNPLSPPRPSTATIPPPLSLLPHPSPPSTLPPRSSLNTLNEGRSRGYCSTLDSWLHISQRCRLPQLGNEAMKLGLMTDATIPLSSGSPAARERERHCCGKVGRYRGSRGRS